MIVDDEVSNISSLAEKINRNCPQVKIIATCDNAQDAIASIDSLKPDIVFLDIEMPVMNGFLMLQQLAYKNFELIFTTAYDHYAIKAIRYSALDYLVKPIEVEELKTAVERAEKKRNKEMPNQQLDVLLENIVQKKYNLRKIAVPTTEGFQFIKLDEILYLEASANYSYIYLSNNLRLLVSRTLKTFEEILPADIFIRIHHSYIINKNFAEKYIRGEGGQVVLTNGAVLEVAKRKKAEFLKALGF